MEFYEFIFWAGALIQALLVYIFRETKINFSSQIKKIELDIVEIRKSEFVEKIVKNVIYSPESRSYFKAIFNEALAHKDKNNDSINLAILQHLEKIESKIK